MKKAVLASKTMKNTTCSPASTQASALSARSFSLQRLKQMNFGTANACAVGRENIFKVKMLY
jgi:hypothetical protein